MKKLTLLILLATCLTGNAFAQDHRHQIHAGYGAFSTNHFIDAFSRVIATWITAGQYTTKNASYSGIFHAGYKYAVARKLDIGATYTYGSGKSDAYLFGERSGQFKNQYHTISADVDYRYLTYGRLVLYASMGAGATIYKQRYESHLNHFSHVVLEEERNESSRVHFNMQVSPLGIKYGKQFGVFGEIGMGYKGIFLAGVFARF